jgi:SAM-dependent methyltransferase
MAIERLRYATVASRNGLPGGGVADVALDRPGRHRAGPVKGRDADLFTRSVLEYAAHQPGRTIAILQAGCATAGNDLDIAALRASRYEVALTLVDDDNQATRTAAARRPELSTAVLGDLRAVPLVPRSTDIVHCCRLLDRISHPELVLGRLADALRPGGLLLVRTADRQTAAGFLDRTLPRPLRALTWRSLRPGEPGPYPAVYEPLASARGLAQFATRHGLVISHRGVCGRLEGRRRPVIRTARALVAATSRGRLTAAHDELRYVIRKPEDRFARLVQASEGAGHRLEPAPEAALPPGS